MMKKLRMALTMLSNAFLLGLLVLVYLDQRNPFYYGGFLRSPTSRIYLVLLCGFGLLTGILSMADILDRWR